MKKRLFFLIIISLIALIHPSCEKSDGSFPSSKTLTVNKFIYDYMTVAYFWNKDMPQIDYKLEKDSEEYFYKLLKQPDDKWSFIIDDIDALMAYFEGVQKTYGFSVQPYRLKPGSSQVIFLVEYVYKNSPAENAGLKRGDIFYKIDGQIINDTNFRSLISKDNMVITLGRTDNSGNMIELSPKISISSVVMNLHPVVASAILDVSGNKVGYLAYTAFMDNYDSALDNRFKEFKMANINDLVLDLRYNGGGDVSSAQKLSALIAPSSAIGSVFIKETWNEEMTEYFKEENGDKPDLFLIKFEPQQHNLNLSRLFVLTTSGTASASEMVIYGLSPYMEVIQIGEETHGKYYGSVTFYDTRKRHKWAIQPIVMRSENATNNIDYSKGLPPTKELTDNNYNAQLGDPEEYFLSAALYKIATGAFPDTDLKTSSIRLIQIKGFKDSVDPLRNTMLFKTPKNLKFPLKENEE